MIIKKIDSYIIRKYLGTFFYLLLIFLSIAIIIDVTEKIDDFLEYKLPIWTIISQYYIHFIPWIGLLLSPVFVFVAVIFFTSRLSNNTEIICMLNGGISFYRLLVPYMVAALALTALFFYANHYLLPKSNVARLKFERAYVYTARTDLDRNFHIQFAPDSLIYMQNYRSKDSTGYKFCFEYITGREMMYKISAKKIQYQGKGKGWKLIDWVERIEKGKKETINFGEGRIEYYKFGPDDLKEDVDFKEGMTTPELETYIAKEKMRGSENLDVYNVELYRRTAVPFGTFILTLIAVSMSSRKVRGGLGIYLVAGLALGGLYVMTQQFSAVFATKGNLDPLIAVWIPNIAFGILAIILIFRAPK